MVKARMMRFKYSLVTGLGFTKNNEAILDAGAINRNYILGAYQGAPYLSQVNIKVENNCLICILKMGHCYTLL